MFWQQKGLVYGDWTSGIEGDGSFIKSGQIPTPEVGQKHTDAIGNLTLGLSL